MWNSSPVYVYHNALAFIVGVALAALTADHLSVTVILGIGGLLLLTSILLFSLGSKGFLMVVALAWVLVGCQYYLVRFQVHEARFSHLRDLRVELSGMVVSPPTERDGKFYFIVAVDQELEGKTTRGRIRIGVDTWAWSFEDRARLDRLNYGDVVVVRGWVRKPTRGGNPGEPNWRNYAYRNGYSATVAVYDPEQLQVVGVNSGGLFGSLLHRLRGKLADLEADLPGSVIPFFRSLLLGDRSLFTVEEQMAIDRAGAAHLLSISGTHIGLLVGAFYFIGRWLRKLKWQCVLVSLPVLYVYLLLTGAQASTLRAVIGIVLAMVSGLCRRTLPPHRWLVLTAWFTLIINPLFITGVGWQLSFAAVFGILSLAPFFTKLLSFLPKKVASSLAISLSAWIAVTPLTLYYFQTASLIAVISNLVLVPLFAVLLFVIFLLGAVGIIVPVVLPWGGIVAHYVAVVFWWLVYRFAELPGFLQVPGFSWFYPALFYFWLIVCRPMLRTVTVVPRTLAWIPTLRWINWTMGLLIVALWFTLFQLWADTIEVVFLDVGQGDAVYIRLPGGYHMLIDAGGQPNAPDRRPYDVGEQVLLPFLRYKGVKKLDLIVITHPHLDHFGGFATVIEAIDVGMVWYNGQHTTEQSFQRLWDLIEQREMACYTVARGDWLQVGDNRITVLHPLRAMVDQGSLSVNDASLVLMLEGNGLRLLFTGDVEARGQRLLLSYEQDLASFALKVPHHGAVSAFDAMFNRLVDPEIAVVQVGRNSFGLPSPAVIDSLQRQGSRVFRTDEDGAVTLRVGPQYWFLWTHRSRVFSYGACYPMVE